jgi:ribonuclease D
VPDNALESYYTFYEKTAFRKWAEVAEARHVLRAASAFVHKKGAWSDYQTWSTAEVQRRQEEFEKEMAGRRERAADEQERKREAAIKAQVDIQVAQAALQSTTDYSSWNNGGDVDNDDSYAGWSYGDNLNWNADYWYAQPGYVWVSRDRVDRRMNNWRGGGGRVGGGARIGGRR